MYVCSTVKISMYHVEVILSKIHLTVIFRRTIFNEIIHSLIKRPHKIRACIFYEFFLAQLMLK